MKVKVESTSVFLGSSELYRFRESLDDKGFRKYILDNSSSFGLLYTPHAPFTNGLVSQSNVNGEVNISTLRAIDSDGNFIVGDNISLPLPDDNSYYFIVASYQESNTEVGEYSIDSSGNLVCTTGNGELTKILRGMPNFPSRVKLLNSSSNLLEYDVQSVIDDNNAILVGEFTPETNLKLVVVGTFPPGVLPISGDKDIFVYDSYNLELKPEPFPNILPSIVQGKEFFLARVKRDGNNLYIEDRRQDLYKTTSFFLQTLLTKTPSKVFGVEQINFSPDITPKYENIVQVGWGLRSDNFNFNTNTNTITVSSGEGGRFKQGDFSLFSNGDFNGWIVYNYNTGKKYKITSSTKQGGQLNLKLENGDLEDFTTSIQNHIIIVPDVEEIEVIFLANPSDNTSLPDKRFTFPVLNGVGKCNLTVYKETNAKYIMLYRYKHGKYYTGWFIPQDDNIGFYNELQFDKDGNLITSPTRTPYTSSYNTGYIPLILNSDAYFYFKDRVDLGDKVGVNTVGLSNSGLQLTVGVDYTHTIIQTSNLTLTNNILIELNTTLQDNTTPIKKGNYFYLTFKLPNINFNGYYIQLRQGSLIPLVGISEGNSGNFLRSNGEITYKCVWSGTGWNVFKLTTHDSNQLRETKDLLLSSTLTLERLDSNFTVTGSPISVNSGTTTISGPLANRSKFFRVTQEGNKLTVNFLLEYTLTRSGFTYLSIPLSQILPNITGVNINGSYLGDFFLQVTNNTVTEGAGKILVTGDRLIMWKEKYNGNYTSNVTTNVGVNTFSLPLWDYSYVNNSGTFIAGSHDEVICGSVTFLID